MRLWKMLAFLLHPGQGRHFLYWILKIWIKNRKAAAFVSIVQSSTSIVLKLRRH